MREYDSCNLCRDRGCACLVPGVLAVLLFAVVGLLVGAAVAETIMANIAAFIVLAVVLFVLLGIWAVVRICRCRCQRD